MSKKKLKPADPKPIDLHLHVDKKFEKDLKDVERAIYDLGSAFEFLTKRIQTFVKVGK